MIVTKGGEIMSDRTVSLKESGYAFDRVELGKRYWKDGNFAILVGKLVEDGYINESGKLTKTIDNKNFTVIEENGFAVVSIVGGSL